MSLGGLLSLKMNAKALFPSPPPLQHCNVMWPTFVFQLRTPMRHLGAPFTREGPERYFSGQSMNRAAGFVSQMITSFQGIRKSCKDLSSLFTAFCQNIPYVSERVWKGCVYLSAQEHGTLPNAF